MRAVLRPNTGTAANAATCWDPALPLRASPLRRNCGQFFVSQCTRAPAMSIGGPTQSLFLLRFLVLLALLLPLLQLLLGERVLDLSSRHG